MTRMTGSDCAVMCNLIITHTHTHTHCEWHRMTRMTGPDCAVMCNLINTHTHAHIADIAMFAVFLMLLTSASLSGLGQRVSPFTCVCMW